MTKEEIKQRNESKEFLKDLQYYLFQNKRSPKIDKLSVLLDNDEKRITDLEAQIEKMKRHANCKHCDSEGYCAVKRTYIIDLSYNGCDKWGLEE